MHENFRSHYVKLRNSLIHNPPPLQKLWTLDSVVYFNIYLFIHSSFGLVEFAVCVIYVVYRQLNIQLSQIDISEFMR